MNDDSDSEDDLPLGLNSDLKYLKSTLSGDPQELPKKIHFVWFGVSGPIKIRYLHSILKLLLLTKSKGYEIHLWVDREESILKTIFQITGEHRVIKNKKILGLHIRTLKELFADIYHSSLFSTCEDAMAYISYIQRHLIGFANAAAGCDLARYYIEWREGGIYMDCDTEFFEDKDSKSLRFFESELFFGFRCNIHYTWSYSSKELKGCGNDFIAAVPQHPMLKRLILQCLTNLKALETQEYLEADMDFKAATAWDALRWPYSKFDLDFIHRRYKKTKFLLTIQSAGPDALLHAIEAFMAEMEAKAKHTIYINQWNSISLEKGAIPGIKVKGSSHASWVNRYDNFELIFIVESKSFPESKTLFSEEKFKKTTVISHNPSWQLVQFNEGGRESITLDEKQLQNTDIWPILGDLEKRLPADGRYHLKEILAASELIKFDRLLTMRQGCTHRKRPHVWSFDDADLKPVPTMFFQRTPIDCRSKSAAENQPAIINAHPIQDEKTAKQSKINVDQEDSKDLDQKQLSDASPKRKTVPAPILPVPGSMSKSLSPQSSPPQTRNQVEMKEYKSQEFQKSEFKILENPIISLYAPKSPLTALPDFYKQRITQMEGAYTTYQQKLLPELQNGNYAALKSRLVFYMITKELAALPNMLPNRTRLKNQLEKFIDSCQFERWQKQDQQAQLKAFFVSYMLLLAMVNDYLAQIDPALPEASIINIMQAMIQSYFDPLSQAYRFAANSDEKTNVNITGQQSTLAVLEVLQDVTTQVLQTKLARPQAEKTIRTRHGLGGVVVVGLSRLSAPVEKVAELVLELIPNASALLAFCIAGKEEKVGQHVSEYLLTTLSQMIRNEFPAHLQNFDQRHYHVNFTIPFKNQNGRQKSLTVGFGTMLTLQVVHQSDQNIWELVTNFPAGLKSDHKDNPQLPGTSKKMMLAHTCMQISNFSSSAKEEQFTLVVSPYLGQALMSAFPAKIKSNLWKDKDKDKDKGEQKTSKAPMLTGPDFLQALVQSDEKQIDVFLQQNGCLSSEASLLTLIKWLSSEKLNQVPQLSGQTQAPTFLLLNQQLGNLWTTVPSLTRMSQDLRDLFLMREQDANVCYRTHLDTYIRLGTLTESCQAGLLLANIKLYDFRNHPEQTQEFVNCYTIYNQAGLQIAENIFHLSSVMKLQLLTDCQQLNSNVLTLVAELPPTQLQVIQRAADQFSSFHKTLTILLAMESESKETSKKIIPNIAIMPARSTLLSKIAGFLNFSRSN